MKETTRGIKFRAWHKKNKVIYPVTNLEWFNGSLPKWHRETYILMQFVGLHDKNRIEIYEGDIVEWDGEYHSVEFDAGSFVLVNPKTPEVVEDVCRQCDFISVVGNIYENSKLLINKNDKQTQIN